MNFLFPLFLLGSMAAAVPILLHLIRQRTRQRVSFSSLMFFQPTLPRFKHRRRLENLLLLFLRCLVVILLAVAFARPYLARPTLQKSVPVGRRMVLLIDTSASMRRAGMGAQLRQTAESLLAQTTALDRVAVMRFDQTLELALGFDEWDSLEPDQRVPTTLTRIAQLSPTWAATDLGQALVGAAEALEDDDIGSEQGGVKQVHLISDLQQGSQVQALQAYTWPVGTELIVKALACESPSNAALQRVPDHGTSGSTTEETGAPRIRVTNAATALSEQFQLNWADASSPGTSVYVVPGHSSLVNAPARSDPPETGRLVLTGDDHAFDNSLYLARPLRRKIKILYLGADDPNDSEAMLYYVKRAFQRDGIHDFQVLARARLDPASLGGTDTAHMIIVTDTVDQASLTALRAYVESGRTVLMALRSAEAGAILYALTGMNTLEVQEAEVDKYAMLEHLDIQHPLLRPFTAPGFGDFTQVHVWQYRQVSIPDAASVQVLARFDTDDPAWFSLKLGQGQLVCMACGWHPEDSDLALSSKFVPLIHSILESGGALTAQASQYVVGDTVPLPALHAGSDMRIRLPDNTTVPVPSGQENFAATDQPGIYAVESLAGRHAFAVNLAPRESRTAVMPTDELEQLGAVLKDSFAESVAPTSQLRQQRNLAALEHEQKIWRWVLLAVWMVLLMEIGLSAWLTRITPGLQGEQP